MVAEEALEEVAEEEVCKLPNYLNRTLLFTQFTARICNYFISDVGFKGLFPDLCYVADIILD